MCDNSRLKEIRNIRLSQNTIPNYIELGLVRSLMRHAFNFKINQKFSPKFIKSMCSRSNNSNYEIPDFLINVMALHFNIMFKKEEHVDHFLKMFSKVHGLMATKLLVNYQFMDNIINPCCGNAFNALMAACLWTNNTKMINVLYNYGADISSINSSGLYCEELHSNIPYYNPFGNYLKYHHTCQHNNNHVWGYRLSNNFLDIIQHVRLICGESVQANFNFPTRISKLDETSDENASDESHDDTQNSMNNGSGAFDIYYNYSLIDNANEVNDNDVNNVNDDVNDLSSDGEVPDLVDLENIQDDDNIRDENQDDFDTEDESEDGEIYNV